MSGCCDLELPAALSLQEEALLALRSTDQSSSELIERNLRLAMAIARRFRNTGYPLDDLFSEACAGLMRAAQTYDSRTRIKFSTYAGVCVRNAIILYLRRRRVAYRREVSLETPVSRDRSGKERRLSEILCSSRDPVAECVQGKDDLATLRNALARLPELQRKVIFMRFGLTAGGRMKQLEIGQNLGISQSRVSRIEKQGLAALKRYMEEGPISSQSFPESRRK